MKRYIFLVLMVLLVSSCGPKYVKMGQPNAKLNLIIFVDTPFLNIEPLDEYTSKSTFYERLISAFAYKNGVFVLDDRVILKEAIAKGMSPICDYKNNDPKKKIINLSFYGADISKFLEMAKGLRASHIVIAKLYDNTVTAGPYLPYKKNIPLVPGAILTITEQPSECSPKETLTQTITAKFTVISVITGKAVVNGEVLSVSKSTGPFIGTALLTSFVFKNLADNLIARIQSFGNFSNASGLPVQRNTLASSEIEGGYNKPAMQVERYKLNIADEIEKDERAKSALKIIKDPSTRKMSMHQVLTKMPSGVRVVKVKMEEGTKLRNKSGVLFGIFLGDSIEHLEKGAVLVLTGNKEGSLFVEAKSPSGKIGWIFLRHVEGPANKKER